MTQPFNPNSYLVGAHVPNVIGPAHIPGVTAANVPAVVPKAVPAAHALVPAHVGGSAQIDIRTLPVSQQQTLLAHAGYHVTVDGITGPQTQTALKAYLSGVPAAKWNHAWAADVAVKPHTDAQRSTYGSTSAATTGTTGGTATAGTTTAAPSGWDQLVQQALQTIMNPTVTSPAVLQQQATQQAQALLAPQLAANRAAQTQAQQQYQAALAGARGDSQRAQQQALSDAAWQGKQQGNIAAALAGILKGVGPATEQAYSNATADTKALAGGFSDTLRQGAQQSADSTNSFLQSIGAPDTQMLNPAVGVGGGDVAYGLGGALPGAALAREGAAAAAAANRLPATAAGMGQVAANAALAQGVANRQDLRNGLLATQDQLRAGLLGQQGTLRGDLSTIQAGRSALVQQQLSGLQTAEQQRQANAQNAALAPIVLRGQLQDFTGTDPFTGQPTTTQAGINTKNAAVKLAAAKANAANRPHFDASASRVLGYRADQNGNPMGKRLQVNPGWEINNKGEIVKAAAGTKKGKALSLKDRQKFVSTAESMASLLKDGGQDANGNDLAALPYDQAIEEFRKQGFFSSQPLRAIAMSALWGQYGKPGSSVVDHSRPNTTG